MPNLTDRAIRRIGAATRAYEGKPTNSRPERDYPTYVINKRVAKITTAVGAATATSWGKGQAQLCTLAADSSGNVLPAPIAGIPPIQVVSGDTSGTGTGRFVQVSFIDGFWVIDVDYCT